MSDRPNLDGLRNDIALHEADRERPFRMRHTTATALIAALDAVLALADDAQSRFGSPTHSAQVLVSDIRAAIHTHIDTGGTS